MLINNKRDCILILLLILSFLIYNSVYLSTDTTPLTWDDALHIRHSVEFYRIITNPSTDIFSQLVNVTTFYPPFLPFSTALLYLILGVSVNVAVMINMVYLAILIFSTYNIGTRLFSRGTGLLAALLIAVYPYIFNSERIYLYDLPLTAMVALTIYLLLLTNKFTDKKFSIIFGVMFGLAMLTKWSALFFVIGPFISVLHEALFKFSIDERLANMLKVGSKRSERTLLECEQCKKIIQYKYITYKNKKFCSTNCKRAWRSKKVKTFDKTSKELFNAALAGIAAFIVGATWYIPNLGVINALRQGQEYWGTIEGDPDVYSQPLYSLLWYLKALIDPQIFIGFFVLFLIGLIFLLKSNKNKIFLISWILLPYITFSFIHNKDIRYTMPFLPAVALISAVWIDALKTKKIKNYAIASIVIFGLIQLVTMAGGINGISEKTTISTPYGKMALYPGGNPPPKNWNWHIYDAISSIQMDSIKYKNLQGYQIVVAVIQDHQYINGQSFSYYGYEKGLPYIFINLAYIPEQEYYDNFNRIDYFIVKTNFNASDSYSYGEKIVRMQQYFDAHYNSSYKLLEEFNLPDGSNMLLYTRI